MLPYSTHCLSYPKALALAPKTVKKFLKIDHDEDDEIIIALIKSVTTQCQNYTGYALITQSWQATYERVVKNTIFLPHQPVSQINKVYLINHRDKKTLFSKDYYKFDPDISEIEFFIHPIARRLRIEYTCGFGDLCSSVPDELQTAMLEHIAYIYQHRGDASDFDFSIYNSFRQIRF